MERMSKLNGKSEDLNILLGDLQEQPLHIVKINDDYFVKSNDIDNLSNQQIYEFINERVKIINNVFNLAYGYNPHFNSTSVYEFHDDGTIKKNASASAIITATVVAKANGCQISANGVKVKCISMLPKWLKIQNSEVDKVLELWAEPNWYNLYKIYEIIRDDFGDDDLMRNKFQISLETLKLFKYTANNRKAIGDEARHATLKNSPPKNPMSKINAKNLIMKIIKEWLEIKSNI